MASIAASRDQTPPTAGAGEPAGADGRPAGPPPRQPDRAAAQRAPSIAQQRRSLRNNVISLAVFFALVAGLLLGVPSLRSAADHISDAKPAWVAAGVGLEILSCAGYVVLFDLVFGQLGGRLTSRLSLAELAINSIVSVSGLAGIALGAWVLRSRGVSFERIARRSVLIFLLTSVVNVGAVIVIGLLMWLGILPGSRNTLLTLLPAAIALVTLVAVLVVAKWARGAASKERLTHGRIAVALDAVGCGVAEALQLIRRGDWRLGGSLAYWLFDNLTLYACLAAFTHAPSVWVVAMAYLVGMMANSIPVPAGLIAVEGGLVGMLVLFHAHPATLVLAAVVIYRAISLWVPAVIGSLAFLSLRRELGKPLAPQLPG
jgi:uncharacterized membrane protein YbhN (UPF0104 family)